VFIIRVVAVEQETILQHLLVAQEEAVRVDITILGQAQSQELQTQVVVAAVNEIMQVAKVLLVALA
jgi:hypothetical protein